MGKSDVNRRDLLNSVPLGITLAPGVGRLVDGDAFDSDPGRPTPGTQPPEESPNDVFREGTALYTLVKLQNQRTGRCLNIHRGRHDYEGAPVTSYSCADTPDQEWKLFRLSNGNVKLQNQGTGRCLNIHRGRHDYEGAPVTSYSCADTPDQEWKLMHLRTGRRHRIYDTAGSENFFIRPVTAAEHCVDDVVRAFRAIDFGRDRGENFYSRGVGRADTGHMQGVARLPGGWLVHSYSKGVFLSYFPARDEFGHEPWRVRPDRVATVFPELPDEDRGHVGGVHAYGNVVAVPSGGGGEKRVELYRHESGNLRRLSKFVVNRWQGGAHYASILPLATDEWLLAVGKDHRRWRKDHHVHFYVIPSLDGDVLRYLGRWGRGRTRDDFQSLSLLADCSGRVFLVGTGVRVAAVNPHAKLYEVVSFRRSDGNRPKVEVDKLAERAPRSEKNDCNLNAGATFFPTGDGGLAMYCTEKEIRDGNITTREYRDEG